MDAALSEVRAMKHVPSEPFTRASIFLGPVIEAHGFRLVSRDYAEGSEADASAEYALGDIRLRLVWEGTARSFWIESGRQSGGSMISRWTDIEWSVAGQRLPVDEDLSDVRLERIASALAAFLNPDVASTVQSDSKRAPG